ncbi:hypothetical protein GGI07_002832 [Coemansia sp. Benny D115]|nr:hypothetical protein GGI07_002832 [Coemansia sp. Benny D115]
MPVRYLLRRQQQDDNAMVKSIMDEIYVAGGNNNAAAAPTPSAGDIATSPIPTVYPNSSPSQTADGNSTAGHADKITVAGVDPVPTGNPTVASIMKQIAVSGVNNNSAAAPTPSAGNVTTSPIPTAYPNPSPSQTADSNNGADGVDPVPTGDPDVASIMKQIAVIGQSNNGGAPNTTQSKQGNTLSLSSKPTQVPTPAGPTHPAPASSVSGSGSSLNGDAASIMDQIKVIGSGNASGNTGAAPSPTASPTPTKPSNSYPEPSGNVSTSPNPTKAVPSVTQLQPNPDEQSQINLANSQIASIINSLIKNNPDIAQFISVPSISPANYKCQWIAIASFRLFNN